MSLWGPFSFPVIPRILVPLLYLLELTCYPGYCCSSQVLQLSKAIDCLSSMEVCVGPFITVRVSHPAHVFHVGSNCSKSSGLTWWYLQQNDISSVYGRQLRPSKSIYYFGSLLYFPDQQLERRFCLPGTVLFFFLDTL